MTYHEQPSNESPNGTVVERPDEPAAAPCPQLSRVSLYHDGELTDEERSDVTEHLATCRHCAEALTFFGRVSGAFAAAAPEKLEPASKDRLRVLVGGGDRGDAPEARTASNAVPIPAHVRWVRRLTAVAAVLFVVAVCRIAFNHHAPIGPSPTTPASFPNGPVIPKSSPSPTGQPDSQSPVQPGKGASTGPT